VNLLRRLIEWIWPEDRVSPAALRRIRAELDAKERLPPEGTRGAWPKPDKAAEPEKPRRHSAYREPI
jgi:hypothetical protein